MLILIAFALALVLDLAFGEPPAFLHPVVWMGKLIGLLDAIGPKNGKLAPFVYGALSVILSLAMFVVPAYLLLSTGGPPAGGPPVEKVVYVVVSAYLLKCTFSLRTLVRSARKIKCLLLQENIVEARFHMRALVSRDVSKLDPPLLAAATIESVAENTSDSFVAPLFYFLLFGVPGALLYRMANTWDSMIGYHGKYEYLGKFAARLDDVLNLVPARITGGLIVAASYLTGNNGQSAWKTMLRDHRNTESPNAGWPMSAAAGGLKVRLEKIGHYVLGDGVAALTPARIESAVTLMKVSAALWTVIVLVTGGVRFGVIT